MRLVFCHSSVWMALPPWDPPLPGSLTATCPQSCQPTWVALLRSLRRANPKPPDTLYPTSGWSIISSIMGKILMAQGWNLISIKIMLQRHSWAVHSLIYGCWIILVAAKYLETGSWRLDHCPVSQHDWYHFIFPNPVRTTPLISPEGEKMQRMTGHQGPKECQPCVRITVAFASWNPQGSLPTEQ